jgi:hypothetical protein
VFFKIKCLEEFVVKTFYEVEADSIDEAIEEIKARCVPCCNYHVQEPSNFIRVLDHDEVDPDEEDVSDFEE